MFVARLCLLIATLWVGSLWTIGYVVAPTLFATLDDRVLAGTIAGSLFRIEAWLSVACAVTLLVLMRFTGGDAMRKARKHLQWIVLGMAACTLIGYFGLQPFMASLREAAGAAGMMDPALKSRFGMLHGIASIFYLIQSLLGAALIVKLR